MLIGELGEKGLIDRIRKKILKGSSLKSDVICGIGDDAAAFKSTEKTTLVTADVLVDDVHFVSGTIDGRDLGYKSMAVNVSDIAAMAGLPRYAVISLGIPGNMEYGFIDSIYEGMIEAGARFDLQIIGGDTSRSRNLFIDVTIIGDVEPDMITKRSTARPGDRIYATGSLGASGLGLTALKAVSMPYPDAVERLIKRHLRPPARVEEGRILARAGATSMEDISDGLITDLMHIAEESRVGFMLQEELIPIDIDVLKNSLAVSGKKPLELALYGGEDYELICTGPEGLIAEYEKRANQNEVVELSEIGMILDRDKGCVISGVDGRVSQVTDLGYDHFKRYE